MILTVEQSIEKISELAKTQGVNAEALVVESKDFKASFQDQKINSYDVSKTCRLGVRIIDGHHEGISYTESFNQADIESCFTEAINNKEFVNKEFSSSFPETNNQLKSKDFYNPELSSVEVDKKLELAKNLEVKAKDLDKRVHSLPYSAYGDSDKQVWLFNTMGTNAYYQTNSCFAYAYPLCVEGEERGMSFAVEVGRKFENISAKRIADKSVKTSLLKLKNIKPKSGNYSVVLNSNSAQTLLGLVESHLSLKSVDQKTSALAGKMGEKIFSEKLSFVDDPTYERGMGSRSFDAEGTLSTPTTVVEKGVLKTFLTNSVYAKKYDMGNTGNATRGPSSGLGIGSTNLVIEAGSQSFNDLVNMDNEVLVIDQLRGLAGVNPVSGDFSIESEGFMYSGGEFVSGASNFTLSGNIFECLKNIEALGNDVEPSINNIYTPSMFLGKMSVAGS